MKGVEVTLSKISNTMRIRNCFASLERSWKQRKAERPSLWNKRENVSTEWKGEGNENRFSCV